MPDDPEKDPDPELVAYLDGELDPEAARKVESHLDLDPAARAKAESLKKTYDLLDHLPRPEPSPDFTRRTVTRLETPGGSASAPVFAPPRRGAWRAVAWVAAGLLAGVTGFAGRAVAPAGGDALAFSDVRVIESLPLTLGVDDLDTLRRLDDPELFADDPTDPDPAPRPPADPPPTRRDALTALFRSYPPARQQQLRDFDRQFNELDPPTRLRLGGVLERYAVWLDRLPDTDRKEVLSAPSPADRVEAIGRVRKRTWRESLPAAHRAKLAAAATLDERDKLVAGYRKQEADRDAEWAVVRQQWEAIQGNAKPWPFADAALAKQVDDFTTTVLRPRLNPAERAVLEQAWQATRPEGNGFTWTVYGMTLYRFAQTHRYLPEFGNGKPVVKSRADLPDDFIKALNTKVKKATGARLPLAGPGSPPLRWPDFAEAVAAEAKALGVPVNFPIGPARPGEFKEEVNEFVAGPLAKRLSPTERAELDGLKGKWPEYPVRMLRLAREKDMAVPGVTLPGPPSMWEKLYRPQRPNR